MGAQQAHGSDIAANWMLTQPRPHLPTRAKTFNVYFKREAEHCTQPRSP